MALLIVVIDLVIVLLYTALTLNATEKFIAHQSGFQLDERDSDSSAVA
jgi:hypothetical protein